jgi:predicted nucleic acid-binding protein
MIENQNSSEIPGYISIAEAASRLHISAARVHTYIEQGRLDTLKVASMVFVLAESVENFKVKTVSGRPRKNIPIWRESPNDATFIISVVRVQILAGQQKKLMEALRSMKQEKQHLFPGTVARYIAEDDAASGTIEIQLIWKQGDMSENDAYSKELEAFKLSLADVLNWDTARCSTKTVLLHT